MSQLVRVVLVGLLSLAMSLPARPVYAQEQEMVCPGDELVCVFFHQWQLVGESYPLRVVVQNHGSETYPFHIQLTYVGEHTQVTAAHLAEGKGYLSDCVDQSTYCTIWQGEMPPGVWEFVIDVSADQVTWADVQVEVKKGPVGTAYWSTVRYLVPVVKHWP